MYVNVFMWILFFMVCFVPSTLKGYQPGMNKDKIPVLCALLTATIITITIE